MDVLAWRAAFAELRHGALAAAFVAWSALCFWAGGRW